jgi:hypothetical protein
MKVMLVGVQDMEFTTQDGGVIDGVKLHYLETAEGVSGHKTSSKYVARNVFNSFGVNLKSLVECLGTEVDVEYNSYGKMVGLYLGEKEKKAV